ncbi:hypothetical protein QR680_014728 [Steinernema hermaphroditum]|uniref:SAGA-associated factor 11 n=1 Tax=Steinernema hermaphroditum TaxID=289476 RepID=A0AA39I9W4_9BILA|nr:hypothetical protein QR680_014728 [Steinernema hermaphroditum]
MAETQVIRNLDPSTGMTCIACSVVFANFDIQREHYKTEWHRYNLKRKVVGLPPISDHQFDEKVLNSRNQAEKQITEEQNCASLCKACSKVFKSSNAYDNHLNSKRHKENAAKFAKENDESTPMHHKLPAKQPTQNLPNVAAAGNRLMNKAEQMAQDVEDEDDDDDSSSGWVTDHGSDDGDDYLDETDAIPVDSCLFCPQTSASMEKNLVHMSYAHGFFIPEAEYCSDVEGLLKYLGMKVGCGRMCLWCGEKSKTYKTAKDCQRHMLDKQHTRMCHEGELILEYVDFYDFSPLYDTVDGDGDELMEEPEDVDSDGFTLTLPSGARIGHRSLFRYYRQHLRDTPVDGERRRRGREALNGAMGQYMALGWTGTTGALAVQRAKDVRFVQKVIAKQRMKLGMKKLFKTRGRADQMAVKAMGKQEVVPEPEEPEIDLAEMKRRRQEDISEEDAMELLYDDVLMAFITQVAFVHHRASTIGIDLHMLAGSSNGNSNAASSQQPSTSNGKSTSNGARSKHECKCPECGRTIAATRFAPHLENCLGMGRNASRALRRRPAGFYAAGNNFGSKSDTNLVAKDLKGIDATHSATNSIIDDDGSDHEGLDVSVEDDDDDWKGKKTRKRKPAAKRGAKGGKRKR